MSLVQLVFIAGIFILTLLLIYLIAKKQRDKKKIERAIADTSSPETKRSVEEEIYFKALSRTHYEVISLCLNCGHVVKKYLPKKTNIKSIECSNCGIPGTLEPVDRTRLTKTYSDSLEVELPNISEETYGAAAKEVVGKVAPPQSAGKSRLFGK